MELEDTDVASIGWADQLTPERKPTMTPRDPTSEPGIVTKGSPLPPDDTVARLADLIDARGMKIFAIIDQAAEARKASGLQLLSHDAGRLRQPRRRYRRYGSGSTRRSSIFR